MSEQAGAVAPLKILAVDDTAQNLLALQAIFQDDGVELLTAPSGEAALELLLRQDDVALALLDVQMPDMDGYALAELMRGTERTRHVPIIFLTAGAQDEHRSFRGYEAGAVDFLFKPLDARVLRSKVQVFADLYRQRRQLAERVAELRRLQRLNGAMLAALSHDLRTPLTALALNAELLIRRGDPTGRRVKAATAVISRHVDHLVNLAGSPVEELQPQLAPGRLGALVRERVELPLNQALAGGVFELVDEGADDLAHFDAALLAQALDHLLLQAAMHAGDGNVQVVLDAQGRRAMAVRVQFAAPLNRAAAQHLFGSDTGAEGLGAARMGHGLQLPERVARAHGGSVIGRSREGEGTLFELMLPRGL